MQEELGKIIENVKRQRDELKLKITLGRAEARDEWEEVEKKWRQLKGKREILARETGEAAKSVGKSVGKETVTAAKNISEDIKEAYARIRKLL